MVVRVRRDGSFVGALAAGLGLGIGLSLGALFCLGLAPKSLEAGGSGDRAGESIAASAVISSVYNPGSKTLIEQEGLFYLDYKSGRLLATVPAVQTIGNSKRAIGPFVERDLVRDFRLEPGGAPKFLMISGKLTEGWEPIFVFETTSGQVAAYRLTAPTVLAGAGAGARPTLELLEVRPIPRRSAAAPVTE